MFLEKYKAEKENPSFLSKYVARWRDSIYSVKVFSFENPFDLEMEVNSF